MKTRKRLVAGAFAALLSSTAFAFHCPQEMKKIDAWLDFASRDGVILFGAAVAWAVFLAL